jgi:trigger factor
LATASEQVVRLKPTLSFRDGRLEGFDALMAGAQAGESREGEMTVAADAANEPLRGEQIRAQFDVLEVKRLEPAQLTPELLEELGAFKLEADLRDAIQDTLARRLDYEQRQRARRQITSALIEAANWELPPALLQRQSRRELQRAILELQRSGFGEDEIKAHENELRQNSRVATAQALKEHFILERIAEEEEIEAEEADYEQEIHLIAVQTGESVRRVRARLEKGGAMDVLRNQIIERKVIDVILEHARFKEVPFDFETPDVEAVDLAVSGGSQGDIPEAKPGGEAPAPGGRPEEHRPHV